MSQIEMSNFSENLDWVLSSERGAKTRLANAAGITPEYLSEVLAGRKFPSLNVGYEIATAVGIGLDILRLPHRKFLAVMKKVG